MPIRPTDDLAAFYLNFMKSVASAQRHETTRKAAPEREELEQHILQLFKPETGETRPIRAARRALAAPDDTGNADVDEFLKHLQDHSLIHDGSGIADMTDNFLLEHGHDPELVIQAFISELTDHGILDKALPELEFNQGLSHKQISLVVDKLWSEANSSFQYDFITAILNHAQKLQDNNKSQQANQLVAHLTAFAGLFDIERATGFSQAVTEKTAEFFAQAEMANKRAA